MRHFHVTIWYDQYDPLWPFDGTGFTVEWCPLRMGYRSPTFRSNKIRGMKEEQLNLYEIKSLLPEHCPIEENIDYDGHNTNDGTTDPIQHDAESCRLFCMSNYPTATYFKWFNKKGRLCNTCWCKTSKTGRKTSDGIFSGEICLGEWHFVHLAIKVMRI